MTAHGGYALSHVPLTNALHGVGSGKVTRFRCITTPWLFEREICEIVEVRAKRGVSHVAEQWSRRESNPVRGHSMPQRYRSIARYRCEITRMGNPSRPLSSRLIPLRDTESRHICGTGSSHGLGDRFWASGRFGCLPASDLRTSL